MNQILVDINNNIVTVLQSDTNIIQVNTPGPTGIPGPSGSQGPSIPFTLISGNFWVTTSSIEIQGGITGSLQGTSSYSLTASYALNANFNTSSFVTTSSFNNFTSSYNTGSFSGSLNGTSSWAISSSNSLNSDSSISSSWASSSLSSSYASGGNGNFSGSFSGSGANLFNIPSTAITGLNLSQIASGSATASIDPLVFNIGNSTTSSLFQVSTVSGITTLYNNLLFNNDNLYDIGASGATRPRTGYFGTSIITPLINISGLTISELVATDSSKNLQSLSVSTYPSLIELSYGKGVTSSIQTQLNNKASITAYTLSGVSTISTTALNSVYQMTSTIPVEFKTSDANTLLYLDETNERVGVGTSSPISKFDVTGDINVSQYIYMGGTSSLFPRIGKSNTEVQLLLADGSGRADLRAGQVNTTNISNSATGIVVINTNTYVNSSGRILTIPIAPTASANYGLVSLGSGAFDGSTSGFFSGSASGTLIAGNVTTGFAGNLIDLQIAGSTKLFVNSIDFSIGSGNAKINTYGAGNRVDITAAQILAQYSHTYFGGGGGTWGFTNDLAIGSSTASGGARLDITGASLTGSQTNSALNLTQTWNTTGNPTAIKLNVTNTTSGSTSRLLDLQVGGVSKTSIDKTGLISTPTGIDADVTGGGNGFVSAGFSGGLLLNGGVLTINRQYSPDRVNYASGYSRGHSFTSTGTTTILGVGGAAISALSVTVAPTASSNYGLFSIGSGAWDGSTAGFFSGSANGTLIAGNLASGSTSDLMNLQVGGSKKFIVEANGDVRIGNSILINTASSEARIGLTTRSYFLDVYNEIINSRVGNLTLIASNSIIGIGGTTSSFPALKRNGAGLEVRLADDSGYGNLTTGNTTVTGSLTLNYVAVTTTYSILPTDYTINCTSGTFTVTLPTAIGCTGKIYNIKNTGTGVITLDTTLSQNIDDNLSQTINPKSNLMVQSTGSNYIIL